VYAFNVACPTDVQQLASEHSVTVKHVNIIYKLFDDIKSELTARLPAKQVEEILG
jgi:translation initiation factor IF-2